MKNNLFKTLLPITSVASILAPISCITSCSLAKINFKLLENGTANEFNPSTLESDLPTGNYSIDNALSLYFEKANKNPKIISDDIIYYLSSIAKYYEEMGVESISNWNYQITIKAINVEKKTMSIKCIESLTYNQDSALYYKGTYKTSWELTNFPFYAYSYSDGRKSIWSIIPYLILDETTKQDKTWKVKYSFKFKGDAKIDDINYTLNYTNCEDDNFTSKLNEGVSGCKIIDSYFLSKLILD